jgi:hypothetical protein
VLCLAVVAVAFAAAPASAREPVDPATLNPAPPDFFNAMCEREGGGIRCTLAFHDPEYPTTDVPSGLACGGVKLLDSADRWVVGWRRYDDAGNLLVRHFRETLEGILRDPETGRSVTYDAQDTVIHRLGVPGDLDTGTVRISGRYVQVREPGGGVVLTDTGTWVEDNDLGGEMVFRSAHHPLVDWGEGDADAISRLCDAVS